MTAVADDHAYFFIDIFTYLRIYLLILYYT